MISVNGKRTDLAAGVCLGAVLAELGVDAEGRGVAVAIDGEVIPQASWATFRLDEDARVEVLAAQQGG